MIETLKVFLNWLFPNYFKKENPVPPRPAAQEPSPAHAIEIDDDDDDTPTLLNAYMHRNAEPAPISPHLRPIPVKPLSPLSPIALSMLAPGKFELSENTAFTPPAKMRL